MPEHDEEVLRDACEWLEEATGLRVTREEELESVPGRTEVDAFLEIVTESGARYCPEGGGRGCYGDQKPLRLRLAMAGQFSADHVTRRYVQRAGASGG